MMIYLNATLEQLATLKAFQTWVGEDNVFIRPIDEAFTIHCYMGNYDMMTEHVIGEDGWTTPPFNEWDIEYREGNPFEYEAESIYGVLRVRAKL